MVNCELVVKYENCLQVLVVQNSVLFLSVFAGIYRERLWPRVCCRKSAFWIEMGKLVPGFMLWMRLRRLEARDSLCSLIWIGTKKFVLGLFDMDKIKIKKDED